MLFSIGLVLIIVAVAALGLALEMGEKVMIKAYADHWKEKSQGEGK